MKAIKHWYGNGKIVLELHDNGALVKHERSKDRLRILGGMAHAIDADMVDEAIALGAETLFISEDGQKIVWEAGLSEVMPLSTIKNIRGIRRRCFDLRNFSIAKGIENAPSWYLFKAAEKEPKPEPKSEQLVMFRPSPGELLVYHETKGGR